MMLTSRLLLVATLLSTPIVVSAQGFPGGPPGGLGGAGGAGGPPRGGMRGGGRPPEPPSAGDLKKQDPIRLLLDKRKKLELTDAQVARLDTMRMALSSRNDSLYRQVDSLRKGLRPPSLGLGEPSGDDRSDFASRIEAYAAAVQRIREQNDEAAQQALAVMSDAQRPKAEALLDEQREKIEKESARRARPQGGFGGGGRPPA